LLFTLGGMKNSHPFLARLGITAMTAMLLTTALAACSSPDTPEVATIDGGSAAATDNTALFAKYGEPARERLDMTDEEYEDLYNPYNKCLSDNGAPTNTESESADTQDLEKAEAVCAPLTPLPPNELDPKNPAALDFVQGILDCMKAQGVEAELADPSGGRLWWSFSNLANADDALDAAMAVEASCKADAGIAR
jgi:hypothetical protein